MTIVSIAANPLVVLRNVLTILVNSVGKWSSESDVSQVIVDLISEFSTFLISKLWVEIRWESVVVIACTETEFWIVVRVSLESEEWVVTLLTSSLAGSDVHHTSLWSLDEVFVIGKISVASNILESRHWTDRVVTSYFTTGAWAALLKIMND
jgi:hypothetical protein